MDNQATWNLSPEDFKDGKTLPMIIREKNIFNSVERTVYDYFQNVCEKQHPEEEASFMQWWGSAVTSGATFNETESARREFLENFYKEDIKTMIDSLYNFFIKDLKKRYSKGAN